MSGYEVKTGFRRMSRGSLADGWHILRTRSRQEKILAAELARMEMNVFLPLTTSARMYVNHIANVELPLFCGYVFLHGSGSDLAAAQRTGRVAEVIGVSDSAILEAELDSIDIALRAGATLAAHPYSRGGVPARVRSGALRGAEGVLEQQGTVALLVLPVRELRLAVCTAVDADLLQKDDQRPVVRGVDKGGSDFPAVLRKLIPPTAGTV